MPHITRLSLLNFRNIASSQVKLSPYVNIVHGENGSGKTSLLEAIGYLAHGRSFRTHKYKHLIRSESPAFTLFGEIEEEGSLSAIGVERSLSGNSKIKADGKIINSSALLANILPVLVLNTHSFQLLEGSPKVRRQFFDWLVFHVKHSFGYYWKHYTKCVKQRNSLLRSGNISYSDLEPWDKQIAKVSKEIAVFRANCFELATAIFDETLVEIKEQIYKTDSPINQPILFEYDQGWLTDENLLELLKQNFERDKRLGYTSVGPHKAQFTVKLGKQNAAEFLSRGQQKLVITALYITMARAFAKATNRKPVFLLDDLPAELDVSNRVLIQKWIQEMMSQSFVTGIEKEQLLADDWLSKQEGKVFHVKHGCITEEIESSSLASF